MKEKKWTISMVSILALTLVVFAVIMGVTDPLLRYGSEKDFFTYYEYAEVYANPGIARQYSYDAVLVGSSMIQNTDAEECNQAFNCNVVKLPYSGGTSYNMKRILDVCFESDNEIKTVYWGLDEFQLQGSATEPRYPLPEYLYKESHLSDASYLLNMDIFYHYTVNNVLGTLKGQKQGLMRGGQRFTGDFSESAMKATYNRPAKSENVINFQDIKPQIDENLSKNIIPLVETHPNTDFVFFMVPYSVLYWDNEIQIGRFDATMDGVKYALGELLKYDNVSVYFYQNETDIITNLDNYKDFTHYGPWINSFMVESISKGYGELTIDNYESTIEKMRKDMHAYDFEAVFSD